MNKTVIFSLHHAGTTCPVLWFTPDMRDMKRIELVFLAKQLLGEPRARGRG